MKIKLTSTDDVAKVTGALLNAGYSVTIKPIIVKSKYEIWTEYILDYKESQKEEVKI